MVEGFSVRDDKNPNRFAYIEVMPTRVHGVSTVRLMATFKTIGCSHGKCTHCELGKNSFEGIKAENLKRQMDAVVDELKRRGVPLEKIGLVDLLTNGSFLDPKEVPVKAREAIVRQAGETFNKALKVVIDSRPEYVTKGSVKPLVDELRRSGKSLEVSIGVDTAGWFNRQLVRKGYGFGALRKAFRVLTKCGADRMGYVLVKSPGQNETEAIETAVRAAKKVLAIGNRMDPDPHRTTVSLEPTFVGRLSLLAKLHEEGKHTPIQMFSLAKIVKAIKLIHPRNDVIVGLSAEGITNDPQKQAHNRTERGIDLESTRRAQRDLAHFNETQALGILDKMLGERSAAKSFWVKTLARERLVGRVRRLGERLKILRKVREHDPREQFKYARVGSRNCTRASAVAHAK